MLTRSMQQAQRLVDAESSRLVIQRLLHSGATHAKLVGQRLLLAKHRGELSEYPHLTKQSLHLGPERLGKISNAPKNPSTRCICLFFLP